MCLAEPYREQRIATSLSTRCTRATKLDDNAKVRQCDRVTLQDEPSGEPQSVPDESSLWDDLKLTFSGRSTEETRLRIATALNDPGSREREFLCEGAAAAEPFFAYRRSLDILFADTESQPQSSVVARTTGSHHDIE